MEDNRIVVNCLNMNMESRARRCKLVHLMWGGDLYKKLLLTETCTWWDLRKSPGFIWLSGERVRPCKLSLHMKGLMSSCKKEGKAAL